ncbi:transposase, partial [Enterococcus faecium]
IIPCPFGKSCQYASQNGVNGFPRLRKVRSHWF